MIRARPITRLVFIYAYRRTVVFPIMQLCMPYVVGRAAPHRLTHLLIHHTVHAAHNAFGFLYMCIVVSLQSQIHTKRQGCSIKTQNYSYFSWTYLNTITIWNLEKQKVIYIHILILMTKSYFEYIQLFGTCLKCANIF